LEIGFRIEVVAKGVATWKSAPKSKGLIRGVVLSRTNKCSVLERYLTSVLLLSGSLGGGLVSLDRPSLAGLVLPLLLVRSNGLSVGLLLDAGYEDAVTP
jgi:hypothetical protein